MLVIWHDYWMHLLARLRALTPCCKVLVLMDKSTGVKPSLGDSYAQSQQCNYFQLDIFSDLLFWRCGDGISNDSSSRTWQDCSWSVERVHGCQASVRLHECYLLLKSPFSTLKAHFTAAEAWNPGCLEVQQNSATNTPKKTHKIIRFNWISRAWLHQASLLAAFYWKINS